MILMLEDSSVKTLLRMAGIGMFMQGIIRCYVFCEV